MTRYYAHPDGKAFATRPDTDPEDVSVPLPDGVEEVDKVTYDQQLEAARKAADDASDAYLREARQPQVDAGRRLVDLGLTVNEAEAVTGVSVALLGGE